jgi:hypothetical protein
MRHHAKSDASVCSSASTLILVKLTRLERNAIFEAIAQSNLDPAECVYEEGEFADTIRHESGSTIEIRVLVFASSIARDYVLRRTVIDGRPFSELHLPDIERAVLHVISWANDVQLVSRAPDLWAELKRSRTVITDIQQTNSSNAPFTEDERRQIEAQLREITKQLKDQFELTEEQEQRIDEWRDGVIEASERMGRKDWLIYLLGTITALTIAATVPAGLGEHIFAMVIHVLGHLFTGGTEPPQILALWPIGVADQLWEMKYNPQGITSRFSRLLQLMTSSCW